MTPHPRQALPHSASGGGEDTPRGRPQAPSGKRPERAPHTATSRGIACVLVAPPPAHCGVIASSEESGFTPLIPHLSACVPLDLGTV